VISNLGGSPRDVTCPWCSGTGRRQSDIDAQASWRERQEADAAAGAPPSEGSAGAGGPPQADPLQSPLQAPEEPGETPAVSPPTGDTAA
jgi:hypothetical protein